MSVSEGLAGGLKPIEQGAPNPIRPARLGAPRRVGRAVPFHGFGIGPTIAAIYVFVLIVVACLAPVIAPDNPLAIDFVHRLQAPGLHHLLGTDGDGRDVLSRMIFGTRSALVGLVVLVVVAGVVGTVWGLAAGFLGGKTDAVLMRIADTWLAFPGLVLAIAITGVLGPNLVHAMAAVGMVVSPGIARLLRSSVQAIRRAEFVLVSRSLGTSKLRCALVHVLPNAWAPAFIQLWILLSVGLVAEAGLGFLGLTVQPPAADWGSMLATSYQYFRIAPLQAVVPGVAVALTCLALTQVGEGLRRTLIQRR